MGRKTVYNNITSPEKLAQVNKKNMELKQDFLDYLISIDRSKRTLSGYESDLDIFFCWNLEYNDNKYFVDLTKREIAKFQKFAMADWGWSTNRLARVKSVLSSMSNYIENILDDEVPDFRGIVRKVESPIKQPVRDKTIITNEEVRMILDTLVEKKKYQCACVFALAAFGGARKSELLRYKVSYFDDENIMSDAALYQTPEKIKTKGRGTAGKPLTKYTLLDFNKYFDLWMNERNERGVENEYLFVNLDTNEVLKISTLNSYTNTISKILGRPFYFHSLRHQLCTRLSKIGLPANVIQEYFGWSNSSMIEVYDDSEASESFGNFFTKDGIKGSDAKSLSDL